MFGLALRRTLLAGGVLTGFVSALAAQDASVPNFAADSTVAWIAGVPDGINPAGQEFLPPPTGPGPVTFDTAFPYVDTLASRKTGKQETVRIADLSNPILQPWVREELRKTNEKAMSAPVTFIRKERCWPNGVPAFVLYGVSPVYFIQTPKKVTMIWREDHMVRHVYLTDKHSPNIQPSWFGESIGHYENGDTLVVDTVGLNNKTFIDNFRTPHTEQLHVIERFRIIDGGQGIEVSVHVEDPGAFTTPWNAMQHYRRVQLGPMYEQACAENNSAYYGYDVEPIPQDDAPDF